MSHIKTHYIAHTVGPVGPRFSDILGGKGFRHYSPWKMTNIRRFKGSRRVYFAAIFANMVVGIGCISRFLLARPLKLPVTHITNRLSHFPGTINRSGH
eukprot:sb/3478857/